jgi:putative DNA primase/helicase
MVVDMTDTFEEACRSADEKAVAAPKKAEDWLAAFSKKSNEALAAKAAEKKIAPPPDEVALVQALACKTDIEYDKVRSEVAETLGIRVSTLDDKVTARREAMDADEKVGPAHWNVAPAAAPVDGAELLDRLRAVFRRYIMLPPGADVALPLWVLHAWTHDSCEISPILCLTSPTKRCGKTSVMILLTYLTPRSELAANVSTASIFRFIEAEHPTLLIDEADSFLSDNDEMRGVLNSGHTKAGANVVRMVETNGEHVAQRFSTWAPKAIALIKGLPDTLTDRSVVLRLMRKPPGSKVERLRKRDSDEFKALRSQASRWAADHGLKLIDADPPMPETLHDRAADNWRPLLAIADRAGGRWPELARKAACDLTGVEDDGALNVTLLTDVRTAFGPAAVMRSADLAAALAADPEAPWATFNRGNPISQRQIARMLGQFGIISDTVHPPGLSQGKGYKRADLEPQWESYCPPDPGQDAPCPDTPHFQAYKRTNIDETGITCDFSSVQDPPPYGSKTDGLSHSHAGLYGCTDKNGVEADASHSDQRNGGNGAAYHPPVCVLCGSPDPAPNQVAFDGLNIWLHRGCEAGYLGRDDDGSDPGPIPECLRRS